MKLFSLVAGLIGAVSAADVFYGLDYGINTNACPSLDQVKSDFKTIKEYTGRVRIFSLAPCDLGQIALEAANSLDMHLYLGMWIDQYDTFDKELEAMTKIVNSSQSLSKVDAVIVGSEVLYRKDRDANTLAGYLSKVRALVSPHDVLVTNADVYYEFPPVVVEKLDFLMINAFPYWEGVTADKGAQTLYEHYQSVSSKAQGKPVRISETGWPSSGGNFGASIASAENQKTYLSTVLCLTRQKNIDMLWFSAIDEPYKDGVEKYWGIMDSNKSIKSSLSSVISSSSSNCTSF